MNVSFTLSRSQSRFVLLTALYLLSQTRGKSTLASFGASMVMWLGTEFAKTADVLVGNERSSCVANIFISHRSDDAVQAEKLGDSLRSAGHDVILDTWGLQIGDSILEWMDKHLETSRYVVVCYSSTGRGAWMDREWMSSLARQLSGEKVKLLPVLLTGGTPPAILADIKYANLVKDWDSGVTELLKAIK